MTRPDLSFDVNYISSEVSEATVKTAKNMNKKKAKSRKDILRLIKIGSISNLVVKVYTDASFCNQENQTRFSSSQFHKT